MTNHKHELTTVYMIRNVFTIIHISSEKVLVYAILSIIQFAVIPGVNSRTNLKRIRSFQFIESQEYVAYGQLNSLFVIPPPLAPASILLACGLRSVVVLWWLRIGTRDLDVDSLNPHFYHLCG